jgi:hypothetical protein
MQIAMSIVEGALNWNIKKLEYWNIETVVGNPIFRYSNIPFHSRLPLSHFEQPAQKMFNRLGKFGIEFVSQTIN